jgi:hypothetical protein
VDGEAIIPEFAEFAKNGFGRFEVQVLALNRNNTI